MAKSKSKRGFAAMSLEQRRRIASLGGKAAQKRGTGHRWDHEEATAAGRKGGQATQAGGNAVRFTSVTARAAAKARERKRRGR
jgi:general stress protein YciG